MNGTVDETRNEMETETEKMDKQLLEIIYLYSEILGRMLRRLRKGQLCKSQDEFGGMCGVSQHTISNIERMKMFRRFRMIHLVRIAYTVGVFPSDILRRVEMDMIKEYPELMKPFFRKKKYYERTRRRWFKEAGSPMTKLMEAMYLLIRLLNTKKPSQIRDEDLESIRTILGRH